ncbi:hypothetical protein H5410_000669 [Solanum commersonii]|uniref:Uncharacterized protein n=1 Tax=Solanum commersonii TaxID=4109 RepID=A0A9J6AWV7_SOLCO|nr:hypothetical protein H5410_000669 [Solanum commersonii]
MAYIKSTSECKFGDVRHEVELEVKIDTLVIYTQERKLQSGVSEIEARHQGINIPVVRPTLLYEVECWPIKNIHIQKMRVTNTRMFIWMNGHIN